MLFILEGQDPVHVEDSYTWSKWMETHDCKLDYTQLNDTEQVITYFLGIDDHDEKGNVSYFETKVIGGLFDGWSFRYGNYGTALSGHLKVVKDVHCLHIDAA